MKQSYQLLYERGELAKRREQLIERLGECTLCPRKCLVNRLNNERGYCKTGRLAELSSYCAHYGEEPPISGTYGSGTIFFAHCNLACIFCQNYDISQLGKGEETLREHLAEVMLSLQSRGCHNINVVSPGHVIPQIVEALEIAIPAGLTIPLVYNSNGYDNAETIKLLDGIVSVYMPDCKYSSDVHAMELSGAPAYWQTATEALREMYRQVGALVLDENGVATKGLLVRHLVLPNGMAGSREALRFLAEELSPEIYLSVMAQYSPCYCASSDERIARKITHKEYNEALELVERYGFENAFTQSLHSSDIYLPDFDKDNPFV